MRISLFVSVVTGTITISPFALIHPEALSPAVTLRTRLVSLDGLYADGMDATIPAVDAVIFTPEILIFITTNAPIFKELFVAILNPLAAFKDMFWGVILLFNSLIASALSLTESVI